jgi:PAS domain S-box-containing protein
VTIDQLRNPRTLIEWDTMMTFCERMIEYGSTLQDTADVFAVSWRHPGLGRAARWISYVSSSQTAYELLLRTAMLAYHRVMRARFHWLPDGRLHLALQLVEGHRSHPALWWAVKGLLQGVPELLTLPHAEVEETIGRSSAVFLVAFPERAAVRPALSWLSRWLAPGRVVGDVIAQQERLASTFELLRSTHERLRKQADALRESEARYSGVIENSADFILVVNPEGTIAMASPSARTLLELDADGQMRHIVEYVHEEDIARVGAAFECAMREKTTAPIDLRVVSRRGREHWIEASSRQIPNASGPPQVLIVARDITRRVREEEEQRLDAERLELEVQKRTYQLQLVNHDLVELQSRVIAIERMGATRELAGSVAHAINNPLSALIGNAQMLLEEAKASDERERTQRILNQAKRIRAVVEGTLELSRGEKPDLTPEDPADLLSEVQSELEVACRERKVSIELRPPPVPALVCADRTLLRTALVALTENAIEASLPGDVVTLETRIHKKRNVLEFCIQDHGPGIPDDIRARVFEPFFTTKQRGTGLGLSIARAVVARHDGSISLERAEVGTLARVEIPLYVSQTSLARRRVRRGPPAPAATGRANP